ncbi:hypothetical protein [Streptomyces katsurahamanus]|uniref:Lipoprotein n=1 Tax=Streptomyces katsurahamanus TaxID=2577098 RepID=A0ABW9NYV1_9ACTN|nr:hypothetical protein [Streptomyces katsurahamanus]MQS38505.1 hypothetical protein [Streptomyces katsurahamanus]
MRGLRSSMTASVVAGTLLLAGCGGTADSAERPSAGESSASASAKPSPKRTPSRDKAQKREKSSEEVLSDFRAAAEGIGEEVIVHDFPKEREGCQVMVSVLSRNRLGRAEVKRVGDRLQQRGWQGEGLVDGMGDELAGLITESGVWYGTLTASRLPEKAKAQAGPNEWGFLLDAIGRCGKP